MGRTEAPLEPDGSAAVECAIWLRRLRRDAGLTYPEIAERTHYAASSLQGACAGRRLPSKKITLAFVEACGGDVAAWERYWRQLQRLGAEPGRTPEELRPPWLAGEAEPAAEAASWIEQAADEVPEVAAAASVAAVPDPEPTSPRPDAGPAEANGRSTAEPAAAGTARGSLPRALAVAAAAALFGAGLGVGHLLLPARQPAVSGGPTALDSLWEREMEPGGVPSYRQPGDAGPTGPSVTFGATVRISCAVVSPPPSPDLWLRVQSAPWDGRYYVPASDFLLASRTTAAAVAIPSC